MFRSCGGGRRRRYSVQPTRWGAAVRQALPDCACLRRHPLTLGNAAGAYQDRYWHDREFDTVDVLRQLAQEAGVSLVTLSVAWVLANKAITAPIIGASRPVKLDSSLAAAEFTLDDDLKQQLDDRTHQYRMGDAPR